VSRSLQSIWIRVDSTGSIWLTCEEETEGQIWFLDTLLIRKEDGNIKLLVYRKKTHTDQYLNSMSHHPLHQKLGVIRTLFNRCQNVVTEEEDRRQEKEHITSALKKCSYPSWSIRKAKKDMQNKGDKRIKKASQKKELKSTDMVTIPYVKGLSEAFSRILKTYRIFTAVRPHTTLWVKKKGATLSIAITLSILDRFAKFFHCCKEE